MLDTRDLGLVWAPRVEKNQELREDRVWNLHVHLFLHDSVHFQFYNSVFLHEFFEPKVFKEFVFTKTEVKYIQFKPGAVKAKSQVIQINVMFSLVLGLRALWVSS